MNGSTSGAAAPDKKRIFVVGAGERVVNDVLPVLASLEARWDVAGVFTRTPRTLTTADGHNWAADGLDELERRGLDGIDLVYMVVAKGAVPSMLARLAALGPRATDIQLETPALLYKHLGRAPVLAPWRRVWVSEDTTPLPLWELVEAWARANGHGAPDEVLLDRCGYAYHGVAMARRLLGGGRVRRARRRAEGQRDVRTLELLGGGRATIVGPRVYSEGRFLVRFGDTSIGDHPDADVVVRALVSPDAAASDLRCVGFGAGGVTVELDPAESHLLGPWDAPRDGPVATHMHALKRVGLRRLLTRLANGEDGYAFADGLEDMAVDYHLERLRRYVKNPITTPHGPWPGRVLRLLGR
ncbi:hypothetical protein Pla163_10120 [Planctomycetes bacterium Pla163]|uniref:Oxidoreductase family, NAD-binding Rossmann fold n=1 Tax=Rohdeia mirabilis TaxID=2528008 RepID=A0A518CXF3_9BACT|nr:hypothetical protein Pla163_10120 [Planctomycetes bacterium Pla163]